MKVCHIERTGIRPDILINPCTFPSRMTIGMLVGSLASKGGALLGKSVDASAFCNRSGARLTQTELYSVRSDTIVLVQKP